MPSSMDHTELGKLQREVAVVIRVMEEAGIKFNRDYEGRVVGVVMEAEAVVTGTTDVSS